MVSLFLIFSFILQGNQLQTTKYKFDYKIQYAYVDFVDSNRNGIIVNYINSQDNSYFISIYCKKNAEPVMRFLDYQGLTYLNLTNKYEIRTNDFTFDSSKFRRYRNPYIFRRDDYDFIDENDTVFQNKLCKQIVLESNKPKQIKKHKLGKNIYIVDTSYNAKPSLLFATAYEMWKIGKKFPNGIILRKEFIRFKDKLEQSETLTSIEPINFEFIVNGSLWEGVSY